MASVERRYDGRFRIDFCYQGNRFYHSLGRVSKRHAESRRNDLEENLHLLESGRLELPADADLGVFLLSGGKLNSRPGLDQPQSLSELLTRYQKEHPAGVKEDSIRYTEDIHIKHLRRLLGPRTNGRTITTATLHNYVNLRSLEKGRRGRTLSHATVKKEIGTFASIWNKWALPLSLVQGPAPAVSAGASPAPATLESLAASHRRGSPTSRGRPSD